MRADAAPAVERIARDLGHAQRVAEARAVFDDARGARPERWAPDAAKEAWEAAVRGVFEARGRSRGAVSFIAAAAGLDRASVWRTLHGRDGDHQVA